jgi:F-type H+-transporting ATPase subunit delta
VLIYSFVVSGGFAVINPNSVLSINAIEGYPIEDFSIENVRAQLAEAHKVSSGNGSALEIAEAQIEVEVCVSGDYTTWKSLIRHQVLESLQAALK